MPIMSFWQVFLYIYMKLLIAYINYYLVKDNDGKYYYVDSTVKMVKNLFVANGNNMYYFNSEGKMKTNGYLKAVED